MVVQTMRWGQCHRPSASSARGRTTRLGAIGQHVLPTGVRDVEPKALQVQLADLRMTDVQDADPVTDVGPGPELAETRTRGGQLVDERL